MRHLSIAVAVSVMLGATALPATAAENPFSPSATLEEARGQHTATLLADGRVLVVGGHDPDRSVFKPPGYFTLEELDSAEAWHPTSGEFSAAGTVDEARSNHTATLLADGRVLVVAGGKLLDRGLAETWHPETASFSRAGLLLEPRSSFSASRLDDGRVLVVGGRGDDQETIASSEVWDPETGGFSATGALMEARSGHTATTLLDGRVLVVGGWSNAQAPGSDSDEPMVLSSTEVWDPVTETYGSADSLPSARAGHTATFLSDGRVLIIGGGDGADYDTGAVAWDPETDTFDPAGWLLVPRSGHTASLLPDGRVLVIGGHSGRHQLPSAELWDPDTEAFSAAGHLSEARWGFSATALPDGRVLVVGGFGSDGALASAEIWDSGPVTRRSH